jgi:hypothetical protein
MRYVLVLSCLLMLAGPASAGTALDAARNGWSTDYAASKAEAKRTGKPIMLVFRCEP